MSIWETELLDPIYNDPHLGVAAVIITTGGNNLTVKALNLTRPGSFNAAGIDFQTFQPAAKVRMSDLTGIDLQDQVVGGELTMDGKNWSIKSFEYDATPHGNSSGEVRLILKDDLNV